MICVAALVVLSVMAIFSARYRPLAKEAFQCVFLKLRLRPCQSGLDRRVRMQATMPFMKRWPRFGKFLYDYFSWFSALFVILTIASLAYTAWGGYNYALYGNCNGPGSSGFCVFDPSGPGASSTGECTDHVQAPEALVQPVPENLSGFKTIHPDADFTVIFFGCYSCMYTREAAPALYQAMDAHPDVRFVLIDFPIERHANSTLAANAGNCVYDTHPDLYPAYARALFAANLSFGLPDAAMVSPSLNGDAIAACAAKPHPRTDAGIALGAQTGVYGTPTYFIGTKPVVGPLNARSLEKLIKDERKKNAR